MTVMAPVVTVNKYSCESSTSSAYCSDPFLSNNAYYLLANCPESTEYNTFYCIKQTSISASGLRYSTIRSCSNICTQGIQTDNLGGLTIFSCCTTDACNTTNKSLISYYTFMFYILLYIIIKIKIY